MWSRAERDSSPQAARRAAPGGAGNGCSTNARTEALAFSTALTGFFLRPFHHGFDQPAFARLPCPLRLLGGGIRHGRGTQINQGQSLHRLTVAERVFEGFVGQPIPLLEEIHPPHALQPDGRASAFSFGRERLDDGQQFRPRNEGFQAREKLLAAGGLLLFRKLALGKTRLMGHTSEFRKRLLPRLD